MIYSLYDKGRKASKLSFDIHGAHRFCTTASQVGFLAAWRQAELVHAKIGNPNRPTGIKTGLGFAAGALLCMLGLIPKQRWVVTSLTFLATLLLSQAGYGEETVNMDPRDDAKILKRCEREHARIQRSGKITKCPHCNRYVD